MDWMYLVYFLLALLVFWGAKCAGKKEWNEEYTSLKQTKILQGITALFIALHHMGQKTCASWQPIRYQVHGLDVFIPLGYLFVGVFFFCSGLGLYRSLHSKQDYLKGFVRRRIMPIVIAYYLSELIYTVIRLLMGQKMDIREMLWYLSGLHMANSNAWYVVVIPFFYLAFWAAFRFCKREGTAIFLVFLFTLGYTVLGTSIDHQNDWWMQGEWWYNSIILFPMGLLFGKHEKRVTAVLKKGYLFWLLLFFAGVFLTFRQSEWFNAHYWSYYSYWGPMKIPRRLVCVGFQWLAAFFYTAFCFVFMLKARLGNKALAFMGGLTLEFYLMHGAFVELFGFNFLNISKSLVYIKKVPLYIVAVLACSIAAALAFRWLRKDLNDLILVKEPKNENGPPIPEKLLKNRKLRQRLSARQRKLLGLIGKTGLLVILCTFFLSVLSGNENYRMMNGLEFHIPVGYSRTFSDTRYAVWKYEGDDQRPGNLVLDADIRDNIARFSYTAEDIINDYSWLQDAELYVNPQGIRMVRGFVEYAGKRERRYYIEGPDHMTLMCMIENEKYYSISDCEDALLQTANSIRRVY